MGKRILVTGITGTQGGATALELLKLGFVVRGMTRKPESDEAKAMEAAGVQIVRGDFDDLDTVRAALADCWGVYVMGNTWEAGPEQEEVQGRSLVQLAHDMGVEHLVYTSVASASAVSARGIRHFANKDRIERLIRRLGFSSSYVILRPVFFMKNIGGPFFPINDDGGISIAMDPAVPLQMVAPIDIGRYGAMAFQNAEELDGETIEFAGDSVTMPEMCATISEVAGRPVHHVQADIEGVRSYNADLGAMFDWFNAGGYRVRIKQLEAKYGIRPTSFREYAESVNWAPAPVVVAPVESVEQVAETAVTA